jgi:hypothetical protein
MRDGEKIGLEQIRTLVSASAEVAFKGQQRKEVYGWVERVLREQQYRHQSRAARGSAAAVCGQDDGLEPGASDAVDRPLSGAGQGA